MPSSKSRKPSPPDHSSSPRDAGTPSPYVIGAGCAVLHILIGLLLLTPEPYHGGDNALYRGLAQSLFERGRYLELWDPVQRPATLYPPLFPLTLAAALALGLRSWLQLK